LLQFPGSVIHAQTAYASGLGLIGYSYPYATRAIDSAYIPLWLWHEQEDNPVRYLSFLLLISPAAFGQAGTASMQWTFWMRKLRSRFRPHW
jgi:hypothetical protein